MHTLTTLGSVQLPYYENMKDETLFPLEFSKVLIPLIYFGHDHAGYNFQKLSH